MINMRILAYKEHASKSRKYVCKVGTVLSGCILGCDPKTELM